jgi:hypothetical protein
MILFFVQKVLTFLKLLLYLKIIENYFSAKFIFENGLLRAKIKGLYFAKIQREREYIMFN